MRDWLNCDWSDTETLTDEAADACSNARAKLEGLKAEIRQIEENLRRGANSLRDRR
ncbi:hypothetical protein ACLMAL_23980 [Nocardia sp. CWNU-33]|uniref:hypothetical protein n=1 Tax=Nocardia sp. CWNU-33 TaxID=3392117 RepID=UPI00398F4E9F